MSATRVCAACGTPGEGNFCARCGRPLATDGAERRCSACGSAVEADALYCGECGEPVGDRPVRTTRQRLPWVLAGLALVAFAVAISLAIRESTSEREPGMPPTGAVIPSPGQAASDDLDPTGVDLSSMTPREAADRLFDRAMRTRAAGDTARARFFAGMGVQAYENLRPGELDADALFHVGLLQLLQGDPEAASRSADRILGESPTHLLGLVLAERVAEAREDPAGVEEARERFLAALPEERGEDRPGYEEHAPLIEEEAARFGSAP